MDVEETEISITIIFFNNLYAKLTVLEQTKLNLFIKRSISLKNITANSLSRENRRCLVESKILSKTRTRMFMVGCFK